jgi:hypothetical protein
VGSPCGQDVLRHLSTKLNYSVKRSDGDRQHKQLISFLDDLAHMIFEFSADMIASATVCPATGLANSGHGF